MKWRNWAGNQTARPETVLDPRSDDEVADAVRGAHAGGRAVRVVGSGHSFTAAAVANDVLMRVDALSGIRSVDRENLTVTVGAGTPLHVLNDLLHTEGLALANMGDIAYQTVAGAISTGTHGTGLGLGGIATQVRGLRLVDGTGREMVCTGSENSDVLDVARVSLGSLGVITEVTLSVVPAFLLAATEMPMRVDAVLDDIDGLVRGNEHFEFFWVPHTGWALTKRNNRTDGPRDPLPRVRGWFETTFMENVAFGAVCRLGRMYPPAIPRLARALPSSGERRYVDHSHRVFASPRLVHFYEMEQAVPIDALPSALRAVMEMVRRKGYRLNFPVEVRFTAGDDIPLSTAHGRTSAYIAVHVYRGMEFEPFMRDVEDIMRDHEGRPHWGKLHWRDAEELSRLYPRWADFTGMRDRLDPDRTFRNDHTTRVFGP
ncbi:MAG: D-arabinono-1,4-lactone oxidase [Ilumatobacteraceae bacterium]